MSYITPHRRSLGHTRKVVPTEKGIPLGARDKEQMWGHFADLIKNKFGEEGATPEDIYKEVTGPMGLTADTTYELIQHAKDGGYLK